MAANWLPQRPQACACSACLPRGLRWASRAAITTGAITGASLRQGGNDFWFPAQKYASYSIKQGVEASQSAFSTILTVGFAPLFIVATGLARSPCNASPHKDWKIELNAPDLLPPFQPQSLRAGQTSEEFDEDYAPLGESRQVGKQRAPGDDLLADHEIPPGGPAGAGGEKRSQTHGQR